MACTMLLSECVAISDQCYSLRVIHVLVGEGIARVQVQRVIRIRSPRGHRGLSTVCPVVPLW